MEGRPVSNSERGLLLHQLRRRLSVYTELIDKGHTVDVFYFDFSEAFDKVPHVRLMSKVRAHGIDSLVANWIKQWLSGRQHRVALNGTP